MKISVQLMDLCNDFINQLKGLGYDDKSIGIAFLTIGNDKLDEDFVDLVLDNYLLTTEKEVVLKIVEA